MTPASVRAGALVRLVLSTDKAGEALAAAAALRKTLERAGLDPHQFARVVELLLSEAPPTAPEPEPGPPDWREMLAACWQRRDELRERDHEFVMSLYRSRRAPRPKQ